jgi:hypothetical protein
MELILKIVCFGDSLLFSGIGWSTISCAQPISKEFHLRVSALCRHCSHTYEMKNNELMCHRVMYFSQNRPDAVIKNNWPSKAPQGWQHLARAYVFEFLPNGTFLSLENGFRSESLFSGLMSRLVVRILSSITPHQIWESGILGCTTFGAQDAVLVEVQSKGQSEKNARLY